MSPESPRPSAVRLRKRKASAAWLSEELAEIILSCLPAMAAMRLRAVSRSWAALVSSPRFGPFHFANTNLRPAPAFLFNQTNSSSTVLYLCSPGTPAGPADAKLVIDWEDHQQCSGLDLQMPAKPCHGLTVLYISGLLICYVCNPSTGELLRLPKYIVSDNCIHLIAGLVEHKRAGSSIGIGYDPAAKEYKVVCVFASDWQRMGCLVYTLHVGGHWRLPAAGGNHHQPPPWFIPCGPPTSADGSLHWLIPEDYRDYNHRRKSNAVLCFSIADETLKLAPIPPPLVEVDGLNLVELGGFLCIAHHRTTSWHNSMEIWMLGDSDHGEWSMHCRFDLPGMFRGVGIAPLCIDNGGGGKMLLATQQAQVLAYDSNRKTLDTLLSNPIHGYIDSTYSSQLDDDNHGFRRLSIYEESLVRVGRTSEEILLASPQTALEVEVLKRLPARSVLQLKHVCRRWHTLISTNRFIQSYLDECSSKNPSIMLVRAGTQHFAPFRECLDERGFARSPPWNTVCSKPCHGLNLVTTDSCHCLCNPHLNFRMPLPDGGHSRMRMQQLYERVHRMTPGGLIGLAYNHMASEHVVVKLFYRSRDFESGEYSLGCCVWTKRSNWKYLHINPPRPVTDMPPAHVEGKLYWMSEPALGRQKPGPQVVVGFDIIRLAFEILPAPPRGADLGLCRRFAYTVELLGRLCVVHAYPATNKMDIWMWSGEAWRRAYDVCLERWPRYSVRTELVVPLAIDRNDGRILLDTGKEVGYYDPGKQSIETLLSLDEESIEQGKVLAPMLCHESLVAL